MEKISSEQEEDQELQFELNIKSKDEMDSVEQKLKSNGMQKSLVSKVHFTFSLEFLCTIFNTLFQFLCPSHT